MTSLKPYLIRATYDWIIDNGMTPYLLADAEHPEAVLPMAFASEGKITLSVRPQAVQGLLFGNDDIQFTARFAGQAMHVCVPVTAVLGIYAKENEQGMFFGPEEYDDEPPPEKKPPPGRPQLRVVK